MNASASGTDRFTPGPAQAALLASLPLFALLVLAPTHVYVGNPQYFDHKYMLVMHLAAVHALVTIALFLVFYIAPVLRRFIAYPLGIAGVFLCTSYVVTPNVLPELPQGGLAGITEPAIWTLLEAALAIFLLVMVRVVRTRRLVEITSVFAGLLLIALPAFVFIGAHRADDSVSRWMDHAPAWPEQSSNSMDVYHLIFDGFDGTVFGQIVEQAGMSDRFNGFVWYSQAYSNYTSTRLSFPSFMTGRVFDQSITDKSAGAIGRSEGLVSTLADRGMRVTQYNGYFVNNHKRAHRRISSVALENELYGDLRYMIQLLDVSLLVIAPNVLKQETVINYRGIFSHMLRDTSLSVADWTRNPPLISRMLFARLVSDLPQLPLGGNYVNAHLLIPHTPPDLNANCGYEPSRVRNGFTLLEQTVCATVTIGEFADALRRLGRFTDALIVVHSDHGTINRERPLLLVKYPGRADEAMEQVPYPVQLLDVAPTVLQALGLDTSKLEGLPLPQVRADTVREFKVWTAIKRSR